MKKRLSPGIVLTTVVFIAFLAACGGGGGGTSLTNHYDGPTAAAAIGNIVDAEKIVVEAYENSDSSGITEMAAPPMGMASKALSLATETLKAAALYSDTFEEFSDLNCTIDNTGKATVKYSVELSGKYTMTMTYNNLCEWYGTEEEYVNGTVTVSGSLDMTTFEMKSTTLTINSMNMKEYDTTTDPPTLTDDFSLSAKLTMSVSGDTVTMTQDMTAKDNISGESFKVENYKVSVTDTGTAEEITITSGKFYHSEHGSVSISTKAGMPLVEGYWDYHPSTGVLVFTGDGWTAELDFNTGDEFTANLSLDSDNDGTFEVIDHSVDL